MINGRILILSDDLNLTQTDCSIPLLLQFDLSFHFLTAIIHYIHIDLEFDLNLRLFQIIQFQINYLYIVFICKIIH